MGVVAAVRKTLADANGGFVPEGALVLACRGHKGDRPLSWVMRYLRYRLNLPVVRAGDTYALSKTAESRRGLFDGWVNPETGVKPIMLGLGYAPFDPRDMFVIGGTE